jgi:hypothetical protein
VVFICHLAITKKGNDMSLIAKKLIREAMEGLSEDLDPDTAEVAKDETPPTNTSTPALDLAQTIHALYEEIAPTVGYETKEETRTFDVESPNGKLMVAVCQKLLDDKLIMAPEKTEKETPDIVEVPEVTLDTPNADAAAKVELEVPHVEVVTEEVATVNADTDTAAVTETVTSEPTVQEPVVDVEVVTDTNAAEQVPEVQVDVTNNGVAEVAVDAPLEQVEVPVVVDAQPNDTVAEVTPPVEDTSAIITPPDDPVQTAIVEISAVEQAADLAVKAETAANAHQVVEEFKEIQDNVETIRETAAVVNETGGFTQESFSAFQVSLNHFTQRMNLKPIQFDEVSTEAFADGKKVVSMEHLDQLVTAMNAGATELEQRATDALAAFSDALSTALPSARERLGALVVAANQASADGNSPILVGDNVHKLLAVTSKVPEDLIAYFTEYSGLGRSLLTDYATCSLETASKASSFPEALVGDSVEELTNTLSAKIDEIGDPRCKLSATQLDMTLCGEIKLFISLPQPAESDNSVLTKLVKYSSCYAPNDPSAILCCAGDLAETDQGYTRPPLTRDGIKNIAVQLNGLFDIVDVKSFNDSRSNAFSNLSTVIMGANDRFENGPEQLHEVFMTIQKPAQSYLSTVYSLSVWPIYHYLLNLIYTTNAFVVLGQRSLASEVQVQPVEVERPATEVATDKPADSDAAVESDTTQTTQGE